MLYFCVCGLHSACNERGIYLLHVLRDVKLLVFEIPDRDLP